MASIEQVDLATRLFRELVSINNSIVQNVALYNAVLGEYTAKAPGERTAIQAVALERFGVDWSELAALSSKLQAIATEASNQSLVKVKAVF